MVLFLVAETLRLLDLYKSLRDDPRNVTNKGILLKQHAREQLTSALNASFPREQPWTESQVAVKFKNLRSEYVELKWLSSQPGFHDDGVGLSEEWWKNVKRLRPKAHAFRGKLPWIFEPKMKAIVGTQEPKQDHSEAWTAVEEEAEVDNQQLLQSQLQPQEGESSKEVADVGELTAVSSGAEPSDEGVVAPVRKVPQKRPRESDSSKNSEERGVLRAQDDDSDYDRSLARSVEQSSVAAAGMARGFQDLTSMFQEEAARCRVLEQQVVRDTRELSFLVDQRHVLLAIANSLEHSTRATADMAKGYRELVSAFVRGKTDAERQKQPEVDASVQPVTT
uniref:Myb/SANT-like domain-containing protein n=1 Tax=Peronospora matthiolae TaxID=2874970 RepID=A0AAV1U8L5_9STRA